MWRLHCVLSYYRPWRALRQIKTTAPHRYCPIAVHGVEKHQMQMLSPTIFVALKTAKFVIEDNYNNTLSTIALLRKRSNRKNATIRTSDTSATHGIYAKVVNILNYRSVFGKIINLETPLREWWISSFAPTRQNNKFCATLFLRQ